MKNLFYVFFIATFTLASCAKEELYENSAFSQGKKAQDGNKGSNCSDFSYIVKSTSLLMPVRQEDADKMDMQDKLMATPRVSEQLIESTITDRGFSTRITNLSTPSTAPANSSVAMVNQPTYAYAVIDEDGTLHCFDVNGNEIGTGNVNIDVAAVQSIVNACNLPRLDRGSVEAVFNALAKEDGNYTEISADRVMYTRIRDDGSSTKVIFDKNYQVESGRVHFDRNGNVTSSVLSTFTGPSDNPVPSAIQSSFPMRSLTSSVAFNHVTNQEFSNFQKSK